VDDVLGACKAGDFPIMEFDGTIKQLGNRLLSANAYLGRRADGRKALSPPAPTLSSPAVPPIPRCSWRR